MELRQRTLSDQEFVVEVGGALVASSADMFYSYAVACRIALPNKDLVLDFGPLEYLSSLGLRALLRLHKERPIRIVNVGPAVMEVLDVTGFSKIIDVQRQMREVSIENAQLIGRGANGEVYRLPNDTVVKLFAPGTPLEVVRHERELAQRSLIQGIPTAIAYDVVTVRERYGAVYEAVESCTLSHHLATHPDAFDEYARKYVELFRQFHTTHVTSDAFPRTKDLYHGYLDGCRNWYDADELAALRRLVDSIPERDTLIHGDYHANNIMVMDGELLMIDMGDVSCGHPAFDFLATAATQANLPELDPSFAEAHTRMPVATITRLWDHLLVNYFNAKRPEEVARIDQQVRLLSKLKVALAPVVGRGLPEELILSSVNDARQNLLPRVGELVGAIDW